MPRRPTRVAPHELHLPAVSRRQFLHAAATGAAGLAMVPWLDTLLVHAQEAKPATLAPLNRFPRLLQDYYVAKVREIEATQNAKRAALKTKADAEQYVASVRERVRTAFGPLPERTALNAKVTGELKRDGYRVEKVTFESRPGFVVTANCYVPTNRKGPFPAVVGSCGHASNAKAYDAYQSFAQGLARQGYLAFIYDPLGQGERSQYPDEHGKSHVGIGVGEHLLAGNQQFLVGDFLGTWRAWDGIRALDYILARGDVDPQHVGITGNSGGGTLTTWLCSLDPRWTMAAPSCFVTTFRRNLENELPADTEQCPPLAIALGLDHADFLAVMAPKPIILLSQERDYFDVRGTTEALGRLQHLYTLLGQPDNVKLFIGPGEHGYPQEAREAMYNFFNKQTGLPAIEREPALTLEKDADLYCTPEGRVDTLPSRSVFSFTQEKAGTLAKARKPLTGTELAEAVTQTLKLPKQEGAPDYRILRNLKSRKYPLPGATWYAVETEPHMVALVTRLSKTGGTSRPARGSKLATLYVSHLSADQELRTEAVLATAAQADPEVPLYAMDVRGIGEGMPNTCGENSFASPYGCEYFYAIHGLMLDKPLLGQRTHDVLRVLAWLKDQGHEEVQLIGTGYGALPAAFAGLLSPTVNRVTLQRALSSYSETAQTEVYRWPLSAFAPGVLATWDLPDVYAALADKNFQNLELRKPDQAVS